MKKFNFLIIFMMITFCIAAQSNISGDFYVSNSQPFKVVDAPSKLYFSDFNGFTYSVKTDEKFIIIQKFDIYGMREVDRKEYKDTPPYHLAIEVVQIGDKFYYLYESINKKEKTKSVYVREFITEDCSLGPQRLLFTTEGEVVKGTLTEKLGAWGLTGSSSFSVYKSNDESKIMIQYRRKPLKRNDDVNHDILGFFVFDPSFNIIWGKEVTLPHTEAEINNLAYTVSTDGTVYMMTMNRIMKKFQLLTIPAEGYISEHTLECEDFMFNDLFMQETKNGNIGLLGFYANGLDYKFWESSWGSLSFNTNGIRYIEVSKHGDIVTKQDVEFPIEMINQYASKREKNKNEKREDKGNAGIRDIKLREFNIYPDGSVFILGEQYYITSYYNPISKTTTYTYHYYDLVAIRLDSDGEIIWMKKLPKRQEGNRGKGGMGIAYIESDKNHYILFLDNLKNAAIHQSEVPAVHSDGRGGFLTAYKIDDATGEYTKHTIYDSEEVNGMKTYQFQTSRIFNALDNTLIVEVYKKGKEDIMIKMELAE